MILHPYFHKNQNWHRRVILYADAIIQICLSHKNVSVIEHLFCFPPFFIKAAQSLYLLLKSVHHFIRAYYIMHLIGTIMNELTKDRLRENLERHTVYAYLMEINCWGNLCV